MFDPRSLFRVVEHVEWEEDLREYTNGRTNQEMYMAALAALWERWVRGWSFPDFQRAVLAARGGDFVGGLKQVLSTVPQKLSQFRGFYEGLWWSANPDKPPPARGAGARALFDGWGPPSPEEDLMRWLASWLSECAEAVR